MNPTRLTRGVQSLHRLQHIARVLTQHGFGHTVDQLDLGRFVPLWLRRTADSSEKGSQQPANVGKRLTRVANELGPVFIKLGQMLATRPDIVPPDILTELQTLQDRTDPFSSDTAKEIIADELKTPIKDAFQDVEETPIACGSIGQVYRATLANGRAVVVKVRRPGIEQEMRSDMQLLRWLAEAMEKWVVETRPYHPTTLVDEFERTLMRELDFLHEAATTARMHDAFEDEANISIPEVIWSHSTPQILTMEALDGENIFHAIDRDKSRFDRKALAVRLTDLYLRQFFEIGTFHADPHPGNILVSPPARIGLVDFGQFGVISDELAGSLLFMVLGAVNRDVPMIADALAEMDAIPSHTDRKLLTRDLQSMLDKYHGQPVRRLNVGTIFTEMADTIRRHDVTVPRDVILMIKSLATVWGVALKLDPDLDITAMIKPRIATMVRSRLSPKRVLRAGGATAWHLMNFLQSGPQQLREVLRQVSSGRWQLNIRHENVESLGRDLDRSSNRLAFAVVIAGIVIGSSLVLSSQNETQILGISLQTLGVVGYLVAAILGLGLLWAIFRSGRLS